MSQRNILLTGVSSGIGLGLARYYLGLGDAVFGISRRRPAELMEHPNFRFLAIDLTEFERVRSSLDELVSARKLDLVILNAGMLGKIADLRETSLEQLRLLMDTNVWSNKVLLDRLLDNGREIGQVIAISSGAAVNGNRGWNGYSISKAALNMLTRLYAAENPGIHWAAVAPGLVDTAMQDYLCSLDEGGRFPSLAVLRSKRGTDEMPSAADLAPRLAQLFDRLPALVESGDFVDIRNLPAPLVSP